MERYLEKNDALIQLPKSFKTNISQEYCKEQDFQLKASNNVSPEMQKLATALIEDLRRLKIELHKNKALYLTARELLSKEQDKVHEEQKDQDHGAGVARIKKATALSITSTYFLICIRLKRSR